MPQPKITKMGPIVINDTEKTITCSVCKASFNYADMPRYQIIVKIAELTRAHPELF